MTANRIHVFEHLGEPGRNLRAALNRYVENLRALGTGTAVERRVQHVQNVDHPELQNMLRKTRGYETTYANAKRNLENTEAAHNSGAKVLPNPQKTFAKMNKNIDDTGWDLKYKTRFWVSDGDSKILLSMNRDPGDRVRKFNTITIQPLDYVDLARDKATGRAIPKPARIENLW